MGTDREGICPPLGGTGRGHRTQASADGGGFDTRAPRTYVRDRLSQPDVDQRTLDSSRRHSRAAAGACAGGSAAALRQTTSLRRKDRSGVSKRLVAGRGDSASSICTLSVLSWTPRNRWPKLMLSKLPTQRCGYGIRAIPCQRSRPASTHRSLLLVRFAGKHEHLPLRSTRQSEPTPQYFMNHKQVSETCFKHLRRASRSRISTKVIGWQFKLLDVERDASRGWKIERCFRGPRRYLQRFSPFTHCD